MRRGQGWKVTLLAATYHGIGTRPSLHNNIRAPAPPGIETNCGYPARELKDVHLRVSQVGGAMTSRFGLLGTHENPRARPT